MIFFWQKKKKRIHLLKNIETKYNCHPWIATPKKYFLKRKSSWQRTGRTKNFPSTFSFWFCYCLHGDYFKTGHPFLFLNKTSESKNLYYSQIADDFPNCNHMCITFLKLNNWSSFLWNWLKNYNFEYLQILKLMWFLTAIPFLKP